MPLTYGERDYNTERSDIIILATAKSEGVKLIAERKVMNIRTQQVQRNIPNCVASCWFRLAHLLVYQMVMVGSFSDQLVPLLKPVGTYFEYYPRLCHGFCIYCVKGALEKVHLFRQTCIHK